MILPRGVSEGEVVVGGFYAFDVDEKNNTQITHLVFSQPKMILHPDPLL